MREPTFEFNSIWHCRKAEDACARREEMASVVVGVEPDEVTVENAEKDFSPNWKDSEDTSE